MKPSQIHPNYDVYFFTLGTTLQTRTSFLCPAEFTNEADMEMVEPGRLVIIDFDSIKEDLTKLIYAHGQPKLNELTVTDDRPRGIFANRIFKSLRELLYENHVTDAPRAKPSLRVENRIEHPAKDPIKHPI